MCCPDDAINKTSIQSATICLVFNILLPGVGTIINAFLGDNNYGPGLLIGIIQILTVPIFLIGWIWSIIYGVKIMNKSKIEEGENDKERQPLNS